MKLYLTELFGMLVQLDPVEVKIVDQSSWSQEENVAEVTSSEGFIVYQ